LIQLLTALIGGALLEVGGNALVRQALTQRLWPLLFAGLAMLGVYSVLVNRSGLNFDFGRLMGCYIVAFFVVSQVLAAIIFRDVPSTRTIIGGAFIIIGGIIILT
jgi:small multidrug resistance family-3 protein